MGIRFLRGSSKKVIGRIPVVLVIFISLIDLGDRSCFSCPNDMSSEVTSDLLKSLIQALTVNPAHVAAINHSAIGIA